MSKTQRCPNGHLHDPAWDQCPYCPEDAAGPAPAAAGVAARLIIEGRGEPHVLKDGTTILGSDSGCDIVLEDEYVSGRHARVESIRSQSGWRFLLTDLGSTNGTWVEGVEEPVDQRELDDSDVILIGELRLRIEILPDSA